MIAYTGAAPVGSFIAGLELRSGPEDDAIIRMRRDNCHVMTAKDYPSSEQFASPALREDEPSYKQQKVLQGNIPEMPLVPLNPHRGKELQKTNMDQFDSVLNRPSQN